MPQLDSTPMPGAQAPSRQNRLLKWHQRVLGFCLVVFALELGLFLLVVPWLSSWALNWVPVHSPNLAEFWMSPYFRGALSGLGLLNIYIGCVELVRQLRALFR